MCVCVCVCGGGFIFMENLKFCCVHMLVHINDGKHNAWNEKYYISFLEFDTLTVISRF